PVRGRERGMRAWIQLPAAAPAHASTALRSVRARAAIETERRAYFAGRLREPGRFSGRIDHDPALVSALELPHFGSARRPGAVTTLERTARCGFRAFMHAVVKIVAPERPSITLDAITRGHLLHALVEAGQLALHAAVGQPATFRSHAVERALDEAGPQFLAGI